MLKSAEEDSLYSTYLPMTDSYEYLRKTNDNGIDKTPHEKRYIKKLSQNKQRKTNTNLLQLEPISDFYSSLSRVNDVVTKKHNKSLTKHEIEKQNDHNSSDDAKFKHESINKQSTNLKHAVEEIYGLHSSCIEITKELNFRKELSLKIEHINNRYIALFKIIISEILKLQKEKNCHNNITGLLFSMD
jgi:Gpi18-like mannosyltransferase